MPFKASKIRHLAVVSFAVLAYVLAPGPRDGGSSRWSASIVARALAHEHDGMEVRDILKPRKGSIRQALLAPGSPLADTILDMTLEQIDAATTANKSALSGTGLSGTNISGPRRNKEMLAACYAAGESGTFAREAFCREMVPKVLKGVCWSKTLESMLNWKN